MGRKGKKVCVKTAGGSFKEGTYPDGKKSGGLQKYGAKKVLGPKKTLVRKTLRKKKKAGRGSGAPIFLPGVIWNDEKKKRTTSLWGSEP